MSDYAHNETDRRIAEIEKRLKKEYSRAQKEIQEKCEDYFRRYRLKDEKWQQWVKEGKKTAQEYKDWKKGQLIVGERWEQLKKNIATDLSNTNLIARSIIDGYTPQVYALSHDYATYGIESEGLIDTSYTLYDRQSVERIFRDDPQMLPPPGAKKMARIMDINFPKDVLWNQQQIQSVALQAILQGESIAKIATRISKELGEKNRKAAIRNARTLMTGAENAGRLDAYARAQNMGIKLKQTWVATLDMRTRHEHRLLDGQTVPIGQPFEVDGYKLMFPGDPSAPGHLVYNCFLGKTIFGTNCGVERSYKHLYFGKVVKIKTASGVNFTCTPNHPILTPCGWISAALLNKGDNLLVTSIGNGSAFIGERNINHVHSTMKAFHDSFKRSGFVSRDSTLSVNFHGDIPTTNVEVVAKKRKLGDNLNTACGDGINKFLLKNTDSLVSCKRHLMAGFRRINISALRFVSRRRKALSFFWRGVCHADVHGLGTVTNRDVVLPEYSINDLPGETEIRSDLLDGLSGNVLVDNIVGIKIVPALCHVYNLQTENGYYFVNESIPKIRGKYNCNMAIAKNCRCTTIAQIEGFETDTTAYRTDPDIEGMTYDEWKKSRVEKPKPIKSQEQKSNAIRGAHIKNYKNN